VWGAAADAIDCIVVLVWLLMSVSTTLGLTLLLPFASTLFGFGPLHADDLVLTLAAGAAVLVFARPAQAILAPPTTLVTRGAALLPVGRMAKALVQITNDLIEGVGLARKVSPDTMKLRFAIDGSDCDPR
jgi:hypothetical protein